MVAAMPLEFMTPSLAPRLEWKLSGLPHLLHRFAPCSMPRCGDSTAMNGGQKQQNEHRKHDNICTRWTLGGEMMREVYTSIGSPFAQGSLTDAFAHRADGHPSNAVVLFQSGLEAVSTQHLQAPTRHHAIPSTDTGPPLRLAAHYSNLMGRTLFVAGGCRPSVTRIQRNTTPNTTGMSNHMS